MTGLTIKQQKPADKKWVNESGDLIPLDRINKSERLAEAKLSVLAKERLSLRTVLEKHKKKCFDIAFELYEAFLNENGGINNKSKGKGNITRYNFDRSIKIEINVNEAIAFDEGLLMLAKNKLDEILNDGLSSASDWLKTIIMDAFSTRDGRLDSKRILALLRHEENIPDVRYKQAMAFVRQAIRKPKSKQYFSLYVRNEKGDYVDVHLNFSNI
ncbi:DUF3164 family protein [Mucilaginibacter kameinonensis]|uniref:DUF3164 family protein n=1 Tax=Mucilaginibacter kameinonensis TaxID=452286 RepID=UPI000EF79A10|nr:DUF3164 family protein [Mucilaginibacter kameinonensis]